MLEFRDVEFAPDSTAIDPSFSGFIDMMVKAHKVGPENAARLLNHWPETFDIPASEKIKPQLAQISKQQPDPNEVLVPALRSGDDFSEDEEVVFRLSTPRSPWSKGRIKDVLSGLVTIEESTVSQVTLPAFYTALFRPWERDILKTDEPGSGHLSLARFAIMCSNFDTRMAGHDELIRKTARRFGVKPL